MLVNIQIRGQMGTGLLFMFIWSESGRKIRITENEKLISGQCLTDVMTMEEILLEKEENLKDLKKMKHTVIDKGINYVTKEQLVKSIKGNQDKNYDWYNYMVKILNKINNKETEELFYHIPSVEDGREFLMRQYYTIVSLLPGNNHIYNL